MMSNEFYRPSDGHKSRKYRILVDADILIEFLYNRSNFIEEIELLLGEWIHTHPIELYITDRALRRIKLETEDEALALTTSNFFRKCFGENRIIKTNQNILSEARRSSLPDFESAVECTCARTLDLDAIITQNHSNFSTFDVPIWSISSLTERISMEENLARPNAKHAKNRFLCLPPERIGVLGKYDYNGLAKRVQHCFKHAIGDRCPQLKVRQRGCVVILSGEVSSRQQLNQLVSIALQVEGTALVEIFKVTFTEDRNVRA